MHAPIAHKLIIAACCVAALCLGSCAQRPFLKESLESFHEYTLNNGIPVVVRQNPLSRVHSVVLSIRGGACAVAPDKAGLDSVALQLLCMASERYTDGERREILKRTSSTIATGSDLDFSTIQLQTIDIYFAQTFDLFLDLIMRPAFSQDLFREVRTNALNAYRSDLTDGYARVSRAANRAFFAGHPYQSYINTPVTLKALSLQDVRDFYRHNLVAQRLAVFAVGNFKLDALIARLNETIGSLPQGSAAPNPPPRFAHAGTTRLLLDTNVQLSPDASYLRGNFPIVPPDHADYWPLVLAGKILSDSMNDLLRTRNALVYSTWSAMYNKKTNYGNMSAYRASDPLQAIELITAAVDLAAQGKCVSPYTQKDMPGAYIEIEKALGFYKTSFSTEYFSGLQDNTSVALRMAAAHSSHGDCREYLFSIDKVNQTSAEDIIRVANRYLKDAHIIWALSAHPDTVAAVKKQCSTGMPACESITLQ